MTNNYHSGEDANVIRSARRLKMPLEFSGPAVPLSDSDIAAAAQQLGIEPALVHAVDEVESRGRGFLPDTRPTLLFERHIFSRRTGHKFDGSHPGISNPGAGGYGASGAHQYDRLAEAIALDRKSALQSASFGRYQIMGFNAEACGWAGVEAFVASMCESEAQHLKAFVGYCRANDLVRFLVVHDWRSFTRGYNGSGNVEEYSTKLEAAYRKWSTTLPPPVVALPPDSAVTPRETIKRIQEALGVTSDGSFGPRSREALNAVLAADGQPQLVVR